MKQMESYVGAVYDLNSDKKGFNFDEKLGGKRSNNY